MKPVILESPYKGFTKRHKAYARLAAYNCLFLGEAPMASHLLYTQMLDDTSDFERAMGIAAGFAWRDLAQYTVFYCDFGFSGGMLQALEHCRKNNKLHLFRTLWTPLQQVMIPQTESSYEPNADKALEAT